MGFVRIRKNGKTMNASETAYKSYFKQAGWIVDQKISKNATSVDDEWSSVESDDLLEKPVSDMSPSEVKKAAGLIGISASGKSIKELREEIRKSQR